MINYNWVVTIDIEMHRPHEENCKAHLKLAFFPNKKKQQVLYIFLKLSTKYTMNRKFKI